MQEGAGNIEEEHPAWYFDERRYAYWYYDRDSDAYYLYEASQSADLQGAGGAAYGEPGISGETTFPLDAATGVYGQPQRPENDVQYDLSFYSERHDKAVRVADVPALSCPADEQGSSLPSGWVEDFLIDWYLRGSSGKQQTDESPPWVHETEQMICAESELSWETGYHDSFTMPSVSPMDSKSLASYDNGDICLTEASHGEEADEEGARAWQAQFGQVVRSNDEAQMYPKAINLWNWTTAVPKGKSKSQSSLCLIGQLAPSPSRLHPSMQAGSGFITTSSICEVKLDLVKVSSGEIYRLRQPSLKYIRSVLMYDSSNPTNGWDFPCIKSGGLEDDREHNDNVSNAPKVAHSSFGNPFVPNLNHQRYQHLNKRKLPSSSSIRADLRVPTREESLFDEERRQKYRDRAKERRELYNDSGRGPGHAEGFLKQESLSSASDVDIDVARKGHLKSIHMLERMGWHEGESLGRSKDGLLEPLTGLSNNGRAGIGWRPRPRPVSSSN